MKRLFLILTLSMVSLAVTAQDITSNNLTDFNEIALSGKLNVVLQQADQNSLEIKLINTDASRLVWSCADGKLNIRLRSSSNKDSSADVIIFYKQLNGLSVAAASVRTGGAIISGILNVSTSNGAKLNLEVDSKDITLKTDGNSAVSLSGATTYFTVNANSKSKVDARSLEARCAIAHSTLGAEIFVWGTEKLDATAGTNSVVYYKGTPEIFKRSEKTLGTVEQFALR